MSDSTTHVLLGAGGAISAPLCRHLLEQGRAVRLISRRGYALAGAEPARADLRDPTALGEVIPTGATAYLLAGLPYRARVWAEEWPIVMNAVVEACAARQAKLVFFDNVYMYGQVQGPMTEETPVHPSSRKGAVRARIAGDLMEAARRGRLQACIARAADFYGPGSERTSIPGLLVFAALAAGKRPQWLANADVPHSFTYTPDCGPALATLAEADDSWGQVWHLPTASPPLTGTQFVELAARAFGAPPRLRVLPTWLVRALGLVNPDVRELGEMLYQNVGPYEFASGKFEQRFGLHPTPYAQGIAETVQDYLDSGT